MTQITRPLHGGRLLAASERFGIPPSDWLDLSTGINPNGYPVPPIPARLWTRLPEQLDGLEQAAAAYYGTDNLLPVAGSQPAIQTLPTLIPGNRITLFTPTYSEHLYAWRERNIHCCTTLWEIEQRLDRTDVLLLVNPNNPTGTSFDAAQLLDWHARLQTGKGWMIVDEAFVDATPQISIAAHAGLPNLVILRSIGKFFGLAGARVGFVLGPRDFLAPLEERLGPWTISNPARYCVQHALTNMHWQAATRSQLLRESDRLAGMLAQCGVPPSGGTALFQWAITSRAEEIFEICAREGILLRFFDHPQSLRFGLPACDTAWRRLSKVLKHV